MLTRQELLKRAAVGGAALLMPGVLARCGGSGGGSSGGGQAIKIGVLADLTGPFTPYGKALAQSVELAVDEINKAGGIDGRQIALTVEDAQSNVSATVDKANQLVRRTRADLIIGPIGSDANDAAAKVIAEQNEKLLFYPQLFEGGKCLPTYFAFGLVPSQQVAPFVSFLQKQFGPKAFLFGADYVWPHRSFDIARDIIAKEGGEVAAELYLPLVADDFTELVRKLEQTQPDYMLAMYPAVFGAALKAIDDAGLSGKFGIGNTFLGDLLLPSVAGQSDGMYTALSYFTTIDSPKAKQFLSAFRGKFGADAGPSGAGEGPLAYTAVHMFKQAVEKAGSTDPKEVAEALVGVSFDGPTGKVTMTPSHYLEQPVYFGQVDGAAYKIVDSLPAVTPDEKC